MNKSILSFIFFIFLVSGCSVKPPTEVELEEFFADAINIHNILVTAYNEHRELTLDEEIECNSFETLYGAESEFLKKAKKGTNYTDYILLSSEISLMITNFSLLYSDLNSEHFKENFLNEVNNANEYFLKIDPNITLTKISNSIYETTTNIAETIHNAETESSSNVEDIPTRLMSTKKRLEEAYPDSFSTQESLFEAETEDYYKLQALWGGLTEDEKKTLKKTNERLEEIYYDSPSTHLLLLEKEIESYRNLNQ